MKKEEQGDKSPSPPSCHLAETFHVGPCRGPD